MIKSSTFSKKNDSKNMSFLDSTVILLPTIIDKSVYFFAKLPVFQNAIEKIFFVLNFMH